MAVCLQLFVKAHTLSQDTIAMNHAILWTQNLAELFLGNDGDFSCVKQAYRDSDCVDSFAFDADTCKFSYIFIADRSHGAYFCATLAVITTVVGKRFHFTDVYRGALPVARCVISPVGIWGSGNRNGM